MKKTLKINGMHCNSCEILLKEAIEENGTKVISADHRKGEIIVDMKSENELIAIRKAVEKEGYSLS
ncbi:MAG: heavy-metal-associated domain-containing protein [archaeon]